jgi:hypothetical protein
LMRAGWRVYAGGLGGWWSGSAVTNRLWKSHGRVADHTSWLSAH